MPAEKLQEETISPKVRAMYQAVGDFVMEGADLNKLTVADITGRAGIGKGTAYEYFRTKEELIVNAVLYYEELVIRSILDKMETYDTFQDKFYYLLSCLEEKVNARDCFMKYVHLFSGSGDLSRLLKETETKETSGKSDPLLLIRTLAAFGLEDGVLRADLPKEYLELAVASRVLIYIFHLSHAGLKKHFLPEQMKSLLYEGLEREIGKTDRVLQETEKPKKEVDKVNPI